ncbi:LysM peptidoglycan-binding domain-containing protein [Rhodovulum sp. DZ06]|uniref:LysM peptidoglycan-binding domain-containing protein n=1 Tax=Rhodovulum sp. DZ06 TaxID=3425126 RepID=UPI003D33589B
MRIGGIAGAAAAAAAMLFGAAGAQAQTRAQDISCGQTYTVQRGDTLALIAERAYGATNFELIYLANTEVIGPNPNLIEVGMPLRIPCIGEAPGAAATAPAAAAPGAPGGAPVEAPVEARVRAPEPVRPGATADVRFIGVDGAAPYSDGALPGGGVFAEMMRLALGASGRPASLEIEYAPDWAAQLTALLPGGGYDVGFPWVRPDCGRPGLGAESRARCRSFDFSEPFFEVVLSFYTLQNSDYMGADSHDALQGSRICRPDGMFVGDLEAEGLVEPNVSLVAPPTARDCFRALMAGEVNVVSVDSATAEETLAALPGAARRVRELEGLATLRTLHAVAPRASAQGRRTVERLNQGLQRMRASGEWFSALQKHQAAAAAARK